MKVEPLDHGNAAMNTTFAQYAAATARRTYVGAVPRDMQEQIARMLELHGQDQLVELCDELHVAFDDYWEDYGSSGTYIMHCIQYRPELLRALMAAGLIDEDDLYYVDSLLRVSRTTPQITRIFGKLMKFVTSIYGDYATWLNAVGSRRAEE